MIVPSGLKLGANRRLAGEDVRRRPRGAAGRPVLEPQHVALAAAVGLTELDVRRRLKVAMFSTGDEMVEPGSPRGGAAIYDANRYLLSELLERLGAVVTDLGILADDPDALARALAQAAGAHDLVLTSGGVSTGEADHVRSAVERIGSLVFWRVAIKPGRPVAMGVIPGAPGHSAAFVGLPGNPVAVFVTFVRVVRPLLLRLSGARPQKLVPLPVRAGFSYKKKKDRREYVRVALRRGSDGELEAVKHPQDGAGILTSLTETDGLAGISGGRDDDRAGRERRVPVLRGAYWLNRSHRFRSERRFIAIKARLEYLRATAGFVGGVAEVDKQPAESAGLLARITRVGGVVMLHPHRIGIDPASQCQFRPSASLIGRATNYFPPGPGRGDPRAFGGIGRAGRALHGVETEQSYGRENDCCQHRRQKDAHGVSLPLKDGPDGPRFKD